MHKTPEGLLQTIYLGDRGCKSVLIDSWNQRVAIQVTVISRLKPGAKTWEFHTAGDIPNGLLVFSNVSRIRFDPSGPVPNDLINHISVNEVESATGERTYLFELSIGSVDKVGNSTEVLIEIDATSVHPKIRSDLGLKSHLTSIRLTERYPAYEDKDAVVDS